MKYKTFLFVSLLCWALSSFPQEHPWLNEQLPLDERVDLLMDAMTLEEKLTQVIDEAPAIERLGIPEYNWWNEALHGVARNGRATVFPQAIGMAATFDEDLMYRVATAISDEARAKFNVAQAQNNFSKYAGLTFWSPNINIFRDPRWGRGQETYGEDPYLTSRMGLAFVKGLQGDHPRYLKAAACAKHYAVHSGPEALRHEFDAKPSLHDLYDTYLPAFESLVKEGKVEAVMGAYNRVYGEPACGSLFLLDTLLRQRWGFDGHIVSDCGAIADFFENHKVVPTPQAAAAKAAKAGLNVNCGTYYQYLGKALEEGLININDIDRIVRPLWVTRFRLGFFDRKESNPYNQIGPETVESPQNKALAREAAIRSFVLLKNEHNALPLDKNIRRLFITGPLAADANVLLGNYFGLSSSLSTILEGITSKVGIGTTIEYKPGILLDRQNLNPIDWTTGGAKRADAIIAVMGMSGLLEGEEGESIASVHKGDRPNLDLPANQVDFLRKLRENYTGKLILVLTGGSPITLKDAESLADAILFIWYPGQEGGSALGDILFGDASPSGRLPITFPNSIEQLPPYEDYSMKGRTYRYMEEEPQYPFGFGLSYTRFLYSNGQITEKEGFLTLKLDVSNTGQYAGSEAVQLYISSPLASQFAPKCSLAAIQCVKLGKGETQNVTFRIPVGSLAVIDESGKKILPKGEYTLTVSSSSPGKRSEELGNYNHIELKYKIK